MSRNPMADGDGSSRHSRWAEFRRPGEGRSSSKAPRFFELVKNIPKNGSRFKNWVPDDGHFMSFSPDDDWWLSFSSTNFFAMCDNNQEKWREMAQVEVRWCRAWWVWTTSQIFNEFVALRLDYSLTGGWSGMDGWLTSFTVDRVHLHCLHWYIYKSNCFSTDTLCTTIVFGKYFLPPN